MLKRQQPSQPRQPFNSLTFNISGGIASIPGATVELFHYLTDFTQCVPPPVSIKEGGVMGFGGSSKCSFLLCAQSLLYTAWMLSDLPPEMPGGLPEAPWNHPKVLHSLSSHICCFASGAKGAAAPLQMDASLNNRVHRDVRGLAPLEEHWTLRPFVSIPNLSQCALQVLMWHSPTRLVVIQPWRR